MEPIIYCGRIGFLNKFHRASCSLILAKTCEIDRMGIVLITKPILQMRKGRLILAATQLLVGM